MNFTTQDVIDIVTTDWDLGAEEVICDYSDDEFDIEEDENETEMDEQTNDDDDEVGNLTGLHFL